MNLFQLVGAESNLPKRTRTTGRTKEYYKRLNTRHVGWNGLNGHGNGGQVVVRRQGKRYYAFVGHLKEMGTSIVDVTAPDRLELIAQIPAPANTHTHKVRIAGDVMLVNNEQYGSNEPHEAGLRFFDIRRLDQPAELSFFRTGGKGVHRFWIDEEKDLAYISTEMQGFTGTIFVVVNFSDARNPREVSRWWLPGQWAAGGEKPDWNQDTDRYRLHHPIVLGERAYLSYWDAGFLVLDISRLDSPKLICRRNYHPPYGGATHTALPIARKIGDRDWLIVFNEAMSTKPEQKLAWVVDVTEITNPVSVSTFHIPEDEYRNRGGRCGPHQPFEDPNAKDDLIYAAWTNAGLRIVSIRNPYRPEEVGYFVPNIPHGQEAIATNDVYVDDRDLIYMIDRYDRGLDIVEYNGPR